MITLKPSKTIKAKTHIWKPLTKRITTNYCLNCGLVRLNNERTRKEVKKPCPGEIDVE